MSLYDRERRWEPFIFGPSDEPALPVQLAEASSLSVEAKAACDRVEFRRADDPRVELAEVVTSVRSLQAELSRTLLERCLRAPLGSDGNAVVFDTIEASTLDGGELAVRLEVALDSTDLLLFVTCGLSEAAVRDFVDGRRSGHYCINITLTPDTFATRSTRYLPVEGGAVENVPFAVSERLRALLDIVRLATAETPPTTPEPAQGAPPAADSVEVATGPDLPDQVLAVLGRAAQMPDSTEPRPLVGRFVSLAFEQGDREGVTP